MMAPTVRSAMAATTQGHQPDVEEGDIGHDSSPRGETIAPTARIEGTRRPHEDGPQFVAREPQRH